MKAQATNLFRKTIAISSIVLFFSGCATHPQPTRGLVVDMAGVDQKQYQYDLAECNRLSSQVPSAGESAAGGAIAGALVGAALMAIVGGNSDWALQGAGAGALGGGVGGAAQGVNEKQTILRNCLRNRGYSVYN